MSEKIKAGDRYGVYKVLSITMPTTRINDATVKLKCLKCGEEIEKNYNHMLKQFRHGKMDDCLCYSTTNSRPMSYEYEKLTTALSKLKGYYRSNKEFVCERPKKIFKGMTPKDLDFSDKRFEYAICTKDGSLKFVEGNVTFKPVVKTSTINEIEGNVSVSRKLSKHSKRNKIGKLVHSLKEKTTKEIIEGNQFISFNRCRLIQKIKIGTVYGNAKVEGIEVCKDTGRNCTSVVLRCSKCGNVFTRNIKTFLDGCYFCTMCEKAGYRSYIHKKNSSISKHSDERVKMIMEKAAFECMSDYSKYSSNRYLYCTTFNEISNLKMDSCSNKEGYALDNFIDVFGTSY